MIYGCVTIRKGYKIGEGKHQYSEKVVKIVCLRQNPSSLSDPCLNYLDFVWRIDRSHNLFTIQLYPPLENMFFYHGVCSLV